MEIISEHQIMGHPCRLLFHGFDSVRGKKCVVKVEDSLFVYCTKSVKSNVTAHLRNVFNRADSYFRRKKASINKTPLNLKIYGKIKGGSPINIHFIDDDLTNSDYELANIQLRVKQDRYCDDYLYLCGFENNQYLKIGRSVNPESRRNTFDLNCPQPVNLIYSIKGAGCMEQKIHNEFKHLNTHKEWFYYNDEIVNRFEEIKKEYQ